MPDSKVSLSSLIKAQRKVGSSRTGSIVKAAGQSVLQSIDPRNYLFNRSGVLASLFPSLKGYRPSTGGDNLSSASKSLTPDQVGVMTNQLDDIKMGINTVARNTMILPQMAKEMNIIRQNIIQLVKASGETPRQRASGFFQRAAGTEADYESRLSKDSTDKSPTQLKATGESSEKKGFFSKLFGGITGLFGSIFGGLFDIIKKPLMFGLAGLASAYLLSSDFREKVNGLLDQLFSSILGDENWKKIKEVISKSIDSIVSGIASAAGLTPDQLKQKKNNAIEYGKDVGLAATGAVVGGVAAKQLADAAGRKLITEPLTRKLVGEKEKIKDEVMKKIKDPKTKRFMKYLLKKSPTLFYKLGQRLMLTAGLLAIPIVGWVGSLISLGLSAFTAYQIFRIYLNFLREDEKNETSPEPISKLDSQVTKTIKTSPEQVMASDMSSTGFDYNSYAKRIAQRESAGTGDLRAENTLGYLGRYQMGAMALEDVGLVKKGVGKKGNKALNDPENWTEGLSKEAFLSSEDLQEYAMLIKTQQNYEQLKKLGKITDKSTAKEIGAFLGGSHLAGVTGFTKGGAFKDAFGTPVAEYTVLGAESQTVKLAENNINKGDSIKSMSENINSNNFIAGEIQKLGGLLQLIVPQTNNQNVVMPASGVKGSVYDEELSNFAWRDSY